MHSNTSCSSWKSATSLSREADVQTDGSNANTQQKNRLDSLFLEAQGHGVREFIVFQDNASTILLVKMERRPVGAVPDTSIFDTSSSRTASRLVKRITVLPRRW